MPHDFSKEFFAIYHAAVFEALGEDAPRYNAKIGALLSKAWLKKLKDAPGSAGEFKAAIEEYMQGPFKFADVTEMTFKPPIDSIGGKPGGEAALYVRGCDICNGNEILRNAGKSGYCPISQMVKSAMGKSLHRNVELIGSEKPGPVGECYLNYRVKEEG